MKRDELLMYERSSVRMEYQKGTGTHIQTGTVFAVGLKYVLFWPIDDDENEVEILIKIEDVKCISWLE